MCETGHGLRIAEKPVSQGPSIGIESASHGVPWARSIRATPASP
jgi:hypothetical protein